MILFQQSYKRTVEEVDTYQICRHLKKNRLFMFFTLIFGDFIFNFRKLCCDESCSECLQKFRSLLAGHIVAQLEVFFSSDYL